jgi:hypothetical protein
MIHHRYMASLYRWRYYQHDHRRILRLSVKATSTILSFACSVIYVPIGCRQSFVRYRQPLLTKTTQTWSLPHPENERQWSFNRFRSCIFRNQGIARILVRITVLFTALTGNNAIYQRWNTDTKLIDIANCTTFKSSLLVAENAILIRYY